MQLDGSTVPWKIHGLEWKRWQDRCGAQRPCEELPQEFLP